MTTLKPIPPIAKDAQVTRVEDLVFGPNPDRCPATNRPYERGSGAHPYDMQTRLSIAEAALAERKAAIEAEAARQAAAIAAAAAQKDAPLLRLVRA